MGRKYKTPPLIEALCEFYFEDSHWDDTIPGLFWDKIKAAYPQRKQLEPVDLQINVSHDSTGLVTKKRPPRIQFVSEDKTKIVQISKDLLVVNHLKPYPHFEKWGPEVEQLLKEYVALANPSGIKRIGVRYINNIVLPKAEIEMADYFKIYPQFPEELGKKHGPFIIRVELPTKYENHKTLVSFAQSAPPNAESSSFMLDLYDSCDKKTPVDCSWIQAEINKGHENVETAFENSITPVLRDLFGEVK